MKCREAQKLILDYTATKGIRQDNPDLNRHLQQCTTCRRMSEMYSSAFQALAADRITELNPDFHNKVMETIKPGVARPVKQIWSPDITYQLSRSLAGLAAAIFLGIWIGSRVLTYLFSGPAIPDGAIVSAQDSYAQEISFQDEAVDRLESYFFDNNNSENK